MGAQRVLIPPVTAREPVSRSAVRRDPARRRTSRLQAEHAGRSRAVTLVAHVAQVPVAGLRGPGAEHLRQGCDRSGSRTPAAWPDKQTARASGSRRRSVAARAPARRSAESSDGRPAGRPQTLPRRTPAPARAPARTPSPGPSTNAAGAASAAIRACARGQLSRNDQMDGHLSSAHRVDRPASPTRRRRYRSIARRSEFNTVSLCELGVLMERTFDVVVVIGAGPAGEVAGRPARRAGRQGSGCDRARSRRR